MSLEYILFQSDLCPYRKKKFRHKYVHEREKTIWGHREKAVCKPKREDSEKAKPADTLT
jgi:hypothetical protein